MDMAEDSDLDRWITLINSRGIAGLGARETEEEKLIVECAMMDQFADTARRIVNVDITNILPEQPPLPDFCCDVAGKKLRIELTEFVDPHALQQAKYIASTPTHPLNDVAVTGGLWFSTYNEWFTKLLLESIQKKDRKYVGRDARIDILLIWNEALQVSIEDTCTWLSDFKLPELKTISAVYFQSWYHPSYLARPTWSMRAHPLIGEIEPVRRTT